jgi:hypothetical protein
MVDQHTLPSSLREETYLIAVISPNAKATLVVTSRQISEAVRWIDQQIPVESVDQWAGRKAVLGDIAHYVFEDGIDTDSIKQIGMRAIWMAWRDPSLNERFETNNWLILTVTKDSVGVAVGEGDDKYEIQRNEALSQTSVRH